MAMLNISLLMKEGRIWAMTLSYRRLRSLGTAGIIVGLRVFMSSVRFLMSPEKKPTDPPTRNIALWGDKDKEQVGITLWRCLPVRKFCHETSKLKTIALCSVLQNYRSILFWICQKFELAFAWSSACFIQISVHNFFFFIRGSNNVTCAVVMGMPNGSNSGTLDIWIQICNTYSLKFKYIEGYNEQRKFEFSVIVHI